ncbi:hypothetical protein A1O3_00103 [Capronia epimyces CBS 606.96]|uniref:Zn(2)-C6 fungal-type domain-containing protein n=1 Tax=Capronia epimyces CBS 606.96 TaxID=1182542 RepID=W9YPG1_9EURO|nr:uncharacterized protein A1O3_00103 [Capronia epimyces CBS 606.96]EXJ91555.1 hypothetical protein A1O3_00103 [Capronia epimyces CBS 606.96]
MESVEKNNSNRSAPRASRAARACMRCHARKVRCDVVPGSGDRCSYCDLIDVACELVPERRRWVMPICPYQNTSNEKADNWEPGKRQYRKRQKLNAPEAGHERDRATQAQSHSAVHRLQDSEPPVGVLDLNPGSQPSLNIDVNGVDNHNLNATQQTHNGPPHQLFHLADPPTAHSVCSGGKSSTGCATATVSGFDNQDVWSSPLVAVGYASRQHVVDSETSEKPQPSVPRGDSATVTEVPPSRCFVYSGDTLHHSFLPHMTGHRHFNRRSRRRGSEIQDSTGVAFTHEVFPFTPCPSARWELKTLQPATCGDTVFAHISPVDVFYLTRLKNVLSFPDTPIAGDFLSAFGTHVLPTFPAIDRYELGKMYEQLCDRQITSPMLLHAIFFAASQYVPKESLAMAGFDSVRQSQEYFYDRATALYALNCEYHQLKIIQTLLFISSWWSDFSEEKGAKYWISCCANLALTMGLHKAVPAAARLGPRERSLWRRIFWTVYSRDCNISAAMGRPITINSRDIDVEELTEADFYERQDPSPGISVSSGIRDDQALDLTKHSDTHVFYAIKTARQAALLDRTIAIGLDHALGDEAAIKALRACQSEINALRTELSNYLSQHFGTGAHHADGPDRAEQRWIMFLQLSTERTLSIACRYLRKHFAKRQACEPDVSQSLCEVKAETTRAAARTLGIYEELLELDCLRYSPTYVNTPIFGAMVTYAELIKEAREEGRVDRIATNKYDLGIMILEEMEQHLSPASSWACSLFKILAQKDFFPLRKLPRASRWQSPDPGTGSPHPHTNGHTMRLDHVEESGATTATANIGSPLGPGFTLNDAYLSDFASMPDFSSFFNCSVTNNLDALFPNDLFDRQVYEIAQHQTPLEK